MEPLLRGHPDERPAPLETCCVEAHKGGVGLQQQTRSRRQAQHSRVIMLIFCGFGPLLFYPGCWDLKLNRIDEKTHI